MNLFKWIIKNFWNLFSVIGVLGMFCFSLLYVPDYVKEITTGKVNVVHESLLDDVQELLFFEKDLSISDISSFIKGKELEQGVVYPYNPDELLLQAQERFMGNKFIPLDKREQLLEKIKAIRLSYKPPKTSQQKPFNWTGILTWLFSGLGVLVGSLGAISIVRKLKQDRETEADITSGDIVVTKHHGSMSMAAFEYEKMVGSVLKELGVLKSDKYGTQDGQIDFLAKSGESEYLIEVKRYRKLLGLATAREFIRQVSKSGMDGILVVSSGVTQRTKELISEYNKVTGAEEIHIVTGETKSEVKEQLARIFAISAPNN